MNGLRKLVVAQFLFNVLAWMAAGYWIYEKAEAAEIDDDSVKRLHQKHSELVEDVEAIRESLGETRGRVEYIRETLGSVADYEARVIAVEKEFVQWEREDRLFRDEVRGRIWNLPYTLPGDRASANR